MQTERERESEWSTTTASKNKNTLLQGMKNREGSTVKEKMGKWV